MLGLCKMIDQSDIEFYRRHGYLVVADVFTRGEVDDIRLATEDLVAKSVLTMRRQRDRRNFLRMQSQTRQGTIKTQHNSAAQDTAPHIAFARRSWAPSLLWCLRTGS